ncbi:hypothetical protein MRX96_038681 [Rhipicephalus microplus]
MTTKSGRNASPQCSPCTSSARHLENFSGGYRSSFREVVRRFLRVTVKPPSRARWLRVAEAKSHRRQRGVYILTYRPHCRVHAAPSRAADILQIDTRRCYGKLELGGVSVGTAVPGSSKNSAMHPVQ